MTVHVVLLLQGEGKHKAKRVELVEYSRALTGKWRVLLAFNVLVALSSNHRKSYMYCNCAGYCPLEKAKPWCIIIDNVECISEHQDMAGLVRVGEWSGIDHFIYLQRASWQLL